ncbi:glycoside hydrolase [Coniochaeta ligniaria NRRL 30616]|uniref:Glycoside hydrolase n=1 Tax=Coniochaeta ligniaria NRRL 30616 TaxID=1408157 RepID=A0A1J7J0E0_9PEZI|nr:glycoside hydrolase [Coniochaeta ligniaria NRRL 30616]
MDVTSVDSSYTHIHFAFATIDESTWTVDTSKVNDQFELLKGMTGPKKILSFGGWSFSTDPDTYPIFRQGVTSANRQAFANNVVDFMVNNGLDGLDFDWEYLGAPDIPGIPPGNKDDGANYLEFLKIIHARLPAGKTLSIAASASFWYLKGFPIKDMAPVWITSFI